MLEQDARTRDRTDQHPSTEAEPDSSFSSWDQLCPELNWRLLGNQSSWYERTEATLLQGPKRTCALCTRMQQCVWPRSNQGCVVTTPHCPSPPFHPTTPLSFKAAHRAHFTLFLQRQISQHFLGGKKRREKKTRTYHEVFSSTTSTSAVLRDGPATAWEGLLDPAPFCRWGPIILRSHAQEGDVKNLALCHGLDQFREP